MSTIKSGEGKDLIRSSLESGGDFVNSELCRRMMQEMKALRIQKLQQEDRLLETVTRLSILQHDKGLLPWSIQPEILYSAQLPNFSHGRAGLGGLGGGTDQTDDEVTGSSEMVGSSSSRRHSNTVHLYSISMASLSYQDTREMREFSVACQHFCRLSGKPVSSVRQVDVIEYVHPHEVTQRYQDQKRAFQLAGKNDPDIWTFHGSSDEGVRAIVQHGFKVLKICAVLPVYRVVYLLDGGRLTCPCTCIYFGRTVDQLYIQMICFFEVISIDLLNLLFRWVVLIMVSRYRTAMSTGSEYTRPLGPEIPWATPVGPDR